MSFSWNAVVLACVLCAFNVIAPTQQQADVITADGNTIAEVLQYTNNTFNILTNFIGSELPDAAHAEAATITAKTRTALAECEKLLQSVANIWEYKVCCNEQKVAALAQLNLLRERYVPHVTSAATRLSFF